MTEEERRRKPQGTNSIAGGMRGAAFVCGLELKRVADKLSRRS